MQRQPQTPPNLLIPLTKSALSGRLGTLPIAVGFAETAATAAKAIASGSGDKAANVEKIQGTCAACHVAHREGAAPDFKIK